MKNIKVIVALFIALCFVFPTEADSGKLEKIKKEYINNYSFYEITDSEYFESIADDYVIDEFCGIRVTKKLFNEDLILDINKVCVDDLIKTNNNNNLITVFPTETPRTLSTGYQNVLVIKKAVPEIDDGLGNLPVYISIFYLSNSGIQEFGYYSYIYQYYGSTLTNTVAELIAGLTLSYITGSTFSTIFSIITSAGQLGNIFLEDAFKTNLNNIYQAGNKAIVTVTSTTKSCTTWTNNTYYYENATRNGLIIRSTFREYQNN